MKKRLVCILLALVLTLTTLTGCGAKQSDFPEELEPYAIPWTVDVPAQAQAQESLEFYFMASLGMDVSGGIPGEEPFKWGDACLVAFPDG